MWVTGASSICDSKSVIGAYLHVLVLTEVITNRCKGPFQTRDGLLIQLIHGGTQLVSHFKRGHALHGFAALCTQIESSGILPIVLSIPVSTTLGLVCKLQA